VSRILGRSALLAVLASVAVAGLLAAPAPARAATPDLTIVSEARYDVQPDKRRVRVTLDLTLHNRLKDTKTTRFYFDEAFLAVMPGTSGYRLSWDGDGSPSVRATKRTKTYTLLRLDLARRIYGGKTAKYRLRFDLKDPGGSATRDLRVGTTLVSFPVWAFASDDTPGSSATVVFSAGFEVEVEAGAIPDPTTTGDGRTVFRTGRLGKPLDFFAYLVGDRPGAYAERTVSTTVDGATVTLLVESWPDDEAWADRVSGLLERGLPAIGDRVGLPWPQTDRTLTVREAVSRSTGGYAGLFDPTAGEVEIAYYADAFVVLHEAAHAWFNGSLLADRWANEAFASLYAERAATVLDVKVAPDELTEKLQESAIPFNAWGPVGTESTAAEDYAYAASLAFARTVDERAGADGLALVWADAADRTAAYQPVGTQAEKLTAAPDWRVLLDLLEENTDATYDDLWRTWVARPADLALLDARATARDRYETVLATTDGWRLPRPIRDAMRAWQFEDATGWLDEAAASLDDRRRVEAAATAAGLIAPAGLRLAFEDDDGFADAAEEAAAELETIERYTNAEALRIPPDNPNPLYVLGLWGLTPDADLGEARDAFAEGDLAASADASSDAAAAWASAELVGQGRAFSLLLLTLAVLLAFFLFYTSVRRRRRRRVRMMATPSRR
jgi:hypothetical protein